MQEVVEILCGISLGFLCFPAGCVFQPELCYTHSIEANVGRKSGALLAGNFGIFLFRWLIVAPFVLAGHSEATSGGDPSDQESRVPARRYPPVGNFP